MNWDKASSISEILSSVAILITLVYLAVEINQNAEATQADVRQAMLASDQQLLELLIEDPKLSLSWYKQELDDEEKVRLNYFLFSHLRMRENNWLQYKNGILDDETWQSYSRSLGFIFSARQPRTWWSSLEKEQMFDDEFVAVVNAMIAGLPVVERSPQLSRFD